MIEALLLLASVSPDAAAQSGPAPITVPVSVSASFGPHQSGRLIVFAKKADDGAKPAESVGFNVFSPREASIAARELADLEPGQVATIDGDVDAFPDAFSKLPPGTYQFQAVLDRNHDYNYGGRGAGDLVSNVVTATLPGRVPTLELVREAPARDDVADVLNNAPQNHWDEIKAWLPKLRSVDIPSATLSAFKGVPTSIRGTIALPPGYEQTRQFPVVYAAGGFGSSLASTKANAAMMMARMASGKAPPMIWVYLDHSGSNGLHEFADSANNGPWGTALVTEVIPALERQYHMDAKPSGRFLTGHSSGGWAMLWLQVRYPAFFGGSWPTSPDPSNFHAFLNVDLYAQGANMYRDAAGHATPLARVGGKDIVSVEDYSRSESVMGSYGGQMASFEWVFSPRGADGRPKPMFDRVTGAVDPQVVAYWRDNYDIANIVVRDWPRLKANLDGKIHLTVGTADSFYLDQPAHRLEAAMKSVGAKTDFRYAPGKAHFDLYERDGDDRALLTDIAREIYAVARPVK